MIKYILQHFHSWKHLNLEELLKKTKHKIFQNVKLADAGEFCNSLCALYISH